MVTEHQLELATLQSLLIQFAAQKTIKTDLNKWFWRIWKGEKSVLYHHICLNLIMEGQCAWLVVCQRWTVCLWRQHIYTQIHPQVGQMLFVNHDLWKIRQFKSGQDRQCAREEIIEALKKNIWMTRLLSSPVTWVYFRSSFIAQTPLHSSFPVIRPSLLSPSLGPAFQQARSVFH